MAERYGRYPAISKRPVGHRLSNPNDPAVQLALRSTCPTCQVAPEEWCIGVGGSTMRGRRLTRLHVARCTFLDIGPDGVPVRSTGRG